MQKSGLPSLIDSVFHFLNIRKKNDNVSNLNNLNSDVDVTQTDSQTHSDVQTESPKTDVQTENDLLKEVMKDIKLNKMGGGSKKTSTDKMSTASRKGKIIPKHIL
jgi:hypothetical protein